MSNEYDMLNRLQPFMRQSKVYYEIFKAQSGKLNEKEVNVDDLYDQLFIDTATWALDLYEKELNIKTDLSKPYDERRALIKSKWRGTGKFDKELIEIVALAYENGIVEPQFSNSTINIKYTDVGGIPPNFQDFEAVLEELKPAHLALTFEFAYTRYEELAGVTHDYLSGFTHEQIRNKEAV